jgi:DNA-binding CsgD family transcriptional regulator
MGGSSEPGLTARETEVLRLVAKGYTYKEIADQLFLSTKTVQNHVQNILTKLQLSRRYELMRYAIRRASTGPEPRVLVASRRTHHDAGGPETHGQGHGQQAAR